MKRIAVVVALSLTVALVLAPLMITHVSAQQPTQRVVGPTDRTVLPIPEPDYPHSTVLDARNATPPPRFEVTAPASSTLVAFRRCWTNSNR